MHGMVGCVVRVNNYTSITLRGADAPISLSKTKQGSAATSSPNSRLITWTAGDNYRQMGKSCEGATTGRVIRKLTSCRKRKEAFVST